MNPRASHEVIRLLVDARACIPVSPAPGKFPLVSAQLRSRVHGQPPAVGGSGDAADVFADKRTYPHIIAAAAPTTPPPRRLHRPGGQCRASG